jgi:hypothetical protein
MASLPLQVKVSADLFGPLFILSNAAESAHCDQLCGWQILSCSYHRSEAFARCVLPLTPKSGLYSVDSARCEHPRVTQGMLTWQNLTSTA